MPPKIGPITACIVLLFALCACGGDEGGEEGGQQSDTESFLGPKDVVEKFYADAAELNCEGAGDAAIFHTGVYTDRNEFVEDCENSDDLTWAQQAVIGDPTPASADDLADVQAALPDATDAVTIPVAEGTSPDSPTDLVVVKIDGEWLLVI